MIIKKLSEKIERHFLAQQFSQKQSADLKHFEQIFPNFEQELAISVNRLKDDYDYYIKNVSIGNSAVSIETAALIDMIVRKNKVQRILDLGSGFSSFVFRQYQKDVSIQVEVTSIDADTKWLKKTEKYLAQNGLNTDSLHHWHYFTKNFDGQFDLIFVDMRPVSARVEWAERLQKSLTKSGVMLIDDVHKVHLIAPLLKIYKKHMNELLNLKKITKDGLGRYALLVLPKI